MNDSNGDVRLLRERAFRREAERVAWIEARRAIVDGTLCHHCGSQDLSLDGNFQTPESGYQIYRCGSCGLSQLDSQLGVEDVAVMEDHNPHYQDLPNEDIEVAIKNHSFILDLMQKYVKGTRLLEVGCSHGYKLAAARRAGWEIDGVELSERSCRFARDVLRIPVQQGTIETCRADRPFDAVIAWHVLEHVPSVHSFLAHLRALIRPERYAFIQVPSYARYRELRPWNSQPACFNPAHFWYFTKETLGEQVESHGLEPVYVLDDERTLHLTVIAKRRQGEPPDVPFGHG